jgi:hypothetical protein
MEIYQEIYQTFLEKYSKTETTPSEVGEVLSRLAGIYPNFNLTKIAAEKAYAKICKEEILKNDEMTGKAVSAVKAEKISDASQEAFDFKTARAHVENLEMQIGVLKFFQKALETEYLNSNI